MTLVKVFFFFLRFCRYIIFNFNFYGQRKRVKLPEIGHGLLVRHLRLALVYIVVTVVSDLIRDLEVENTCRFSFLGHSLTY